MRTSSRRLNAIIVSFAAAAALLVAVRPAEACKGGDPPASIDAATVAAFDTIAVAKITKVEAPEKQGRYAPPFRMRATVVQRLRGNLRPGDAIEAATSTEEGHAVCPLDVFKEGATYLVFLRGKGSPYVLPRYDAVDVEDSDPRFASYVETIETFNRVEAKRSGCGACSAASSESDGWLMLAWLALAAVAAVRRIGRPAEGRFSLPV